MLVLSRQGREAYRDEVTVASHDSIIFKMNDSVGMKKKNKTH